MTDKDGLLDRADKVASRADFVAFIRAVAEAYANRDRDDPSDWVNTGVDTFLECGSAWGEAWEGRDDGPFTDDNPWRQAARIIYAGRYYE